MKPGYRKFILSIIMMLSGYYLLAQDDLAKIIEEQEKNAEKVPVTATFKGIRLVSGHTVETNNSGVLLFLIEHRFGELNGGGYELFGLDQATMRLGLEYGIFNWLNIGVGRSTFEKTYDGFLKIKLLQQKTDGFPLTITGLSTIAMKSVEWTEPDRENYFTSRLYYTYQALIASKLSERVSLQMMPSLVHRNLVETSEIKHDVYAVGGGGRVKLSRSIALNAEYYYVFPGQLNAEFVNSASVGFDIETGGHVFQLHFTNSRSMIEKGFITETTGKWSDGGIHFGFNLSRVFTLNRKAALKRK